MICTTYRHNFCSFSMKHAQLKPMPSLESKRVMLAPFYHIWSRKHEKYGKYTLLHCSIVDSTKLKENILWNSKSLILWFNIIRAVTFCSFLEFFNSQNICLLYVKPPNKVHFFSCYVHTN